MIVESFSAFQTEAALINEVAQNARRFELLAAQFSIQIIEYSPVGVQAGLIDNLKGTKGAQTKSET